MWRGDDEPMEAAWHIRARHDHDSTETLVESSAREALRLGADRLRAHGRRPRRH